MSKIIKSIVVLGMIFGMTSFVHAGTFEEKDNVSMDKDINTNNIQDAVNFNSFIVQFDFNDGSGRSTQLEIPEGDLIDGFPLITAPAGKKFTGWAYGFEENDVPAYWDFEKDKMPGYNITLWAVYSDIFKVNFEFNDGSGKSTQLEIPEGDLIDGFPIITAPAGKKFTGWAYGFEENDVPTYWDFEKDKMPGYNITLWAVYSDIFKVNFDFNDGSGKSTQLEIPEGDLIVGAPIITAPAGKKFTGWAYSFDENDNPLYWDFAINKMPNHSITLSAIYETLDEKLEKEENILDLEIVSEKNSKTPNTGLTSSYHLYLIVIALGLTVLTKKLKED